MKLSVQLVTWNGAKYIPHLFHSLRNQLFKDWELLVIDNGSTDGTVEAIKKELADFTLPHRLIENKENKGFAGGHNQAWRETTGEYFLILNQDMYLEPGCLERLVRFMDSHADAAVAAPRLMKWRFSRAGADLVGSFGDEVDALGLKIFRSRRVLEQHGGEVWTEVKKEFIWPELEVFGVSGALAIFRCAAVAMVLDSKGNMFDELFDSYKEDVDLAFRLRAAGFKSFVLLDAVAHHDRQSAGPRGEGALATTENKAAQPETVRFLSYRNHLFLLYKNEYWQNFTLDFLWILWYEFKKLVYNLLFQRQALKAWKELKTNKKELRQERIKILSLRKVSWRDMRRWWR